MKRILPALALLLFSLISCKKTDQSAELYPAIEVGETSGEGFTVENKDVIKTKWQEALHIRGFNDEVNELEIKEITTEGEKTEKRYLLVAKTTDGHTTVSALLRKDGSTFYFDEEVASVICTADCTEGCNAGALLKSGKIVLVCQGCDHCIKTDFFL